MYVSTSLRRSKQSHNRDTRYLAMSGKRVFEMGACVLKTQMSSFSVAECTNLKMKKKKQCASKLIQWRYERCMRITFYDLNFFQIFLFFKFKKYTRRKLYNTLLYQDLTMLSWIFSFKIHIFIPSLNNKAYNTRSRQSCPPLQILYLSHLLFSFFLSTKYQKILKLNI